MIIDAHTHIFSTDMDRYPLGDPTSSYRPVTEGSVTLLRAQMDEAGVDRAVTIPPWFYRWDPSYVLDVLAENRTWLAAAALVDPWSEKGPAQLERLVREFGFCGLRIQATISGLGPFDDPDTTPLWRKAADLGIPIISRYADPARPLWLYLTGAGAHHAQRRTGGAYGRVPQCLCQALLCQQRQPAVLSL
jgi:predicted TIM-barrel fold metal-dependent hydrolase